MFRRLLLALLTCMCALGAAAQEMGQGDRASIIATIRTQLDAFRRDDAEGAFRQAAPSIREMFGTPDRFMAMVRGAYPPVYRGKGVVFGELTIVQGTPIQQVRMDGPGGKRVLALYSMEQGPDGAWRITGCVLVDADEKTV